MTTPAQTTLLNAAELLEANTKTLRHMWRDSPGMCDICDDMQCTALELRLLARSIQTGHTAVPPAPTFEDN